MDSDEDIYNEKVSDVVSSKLTPPSPDCSPLENSGVEGAAPVGHSALVAEKTNEGFQCPVCPRILKSRSGFSRHYNVHKQNELNNRLPQQQDIEGHSEEMMVETLKAIEMEPAVGPMGAVKRTLVGIILSKGNMADLIQVLLPTVLDTVLIKTRMLPSAHHEDCLSKFNHILCQNVLLNQLKQKIESCVCGDISSPCDQSVLSRLAYRISVVFMTKVQERIISLMRKNHADAYADFSMNAEEMEGFKDHVQDMLKAVFSVGMKSASDLWQRRCEVIKNRCAQSNGPITSEEFVRKFRWTNGDVWLSDSCLSLFLGIEKIFQSLKSNAVNPTPDDIFDCFSDFKNVFLLESLRQLTRGILSEDAALALLQDFLKSFVALSGRLEVRQMKQKLKQKVPSVALRTDLKRNRVPSNPSSNIECTKAVASSSKEAESGSENPSKRSSSTAASAKAATKAAEAAQSKAAPTKQRKSVKTSSNSATSRSAIPPKSSISTAATKAAKSKSPTNQGKSAKTSSTSFTARSRNPPKPSSSTVVTGVSATKAAEAGKSKSPTNQPKSAKTSSTSTSASTSTTRSSRSTRSSSK